MHERSLPSSLPSKRLDQRPTESGGQCGLRIVRAGHRFHFDSHTVVIAGALGDLVAQQFVNVAIAISKENQCCSF
jgi:hypothetical protein